MSETAPTPGQTAGLPGANAAPGTAEISDDARDETVATAGVADPEQEARAQARAEAERALE